MYISFNDGALDQVFIDISGVQEAKKYFLEFVRKIHEIKKEEFIENLFFPCNITKYKLSKGYTIDDWLNDRSIEMKYRQFFRSCLGRAVYIDKYDILCEVKIIYPLKNIESIGCAFSKMYSDEAVVISVLTDEFFALDEIPILYEYFDDKDELQCLTTNIKNISEKTDISNLKAENRKRLFENITSGQDFWEHKGEMFPNLVFCESVKKQVYEDCERYHIVKVMQRLTKMQDYFSKRHDLYNPDELGLGARTESDTVKNDSGLKKQRLFRLPTGEMKYFFDHIGFSGKYSAGRIHFIPDVENKRAYIGYIGRHLDTKKY